MFHVFTFYIIIVLKRSVEMAFRKIAFLLSAVFRIFSISANDRVLPK